MADDEQRGPAPGDIGDGWVDESSAALREAGFKSELSEAGRGLKLGREQEEEEEGEGRRFENSTRCRASTLFSASPQCFISLRSESSHGLRKRPQFSAWEN